MNDLKIGHCPRGFGHPCQWREITKGRWKGYQTCIMCGAVVKPLSEFVT